MDYSTATLMRSYSKSKAYMKHYDENTEASLNDWSWLLTCARRQES